MKFPQRSIWWRYRWLLLSLSLILLIVLPKHPFHLTNSASGQVTIPDPQASGAALQTLLNQTVSQQKMPGAVLYLTTPKSNWAGAAGVSSLETNALMQPTDRFSIASASKTYLAVVVLQLVESGQMQLDAPIANYLPADVRPHITNSDRIAVRQLLNHTSGVPEYRFVEGFATATESRSRANPWTARETVQYIFDRPAQFEPGSQYAYTDSNYVLLQLIVETLVGKPIEAAMRDRIFTPLNLANTFTELREAVPGGVVTGYSEPDSQGNRRNLSTLNLGNGLSDGGLVSNAQDVATFLTSLLTQGKLLSQTMLQTMLTFVPASDGGEYGLGIKRWQDNPQVGALLGHGGQYYGFQSFMIYLPKWNMTVVALTNAEDANAVKLAKTAANVALGLEQ
jgi:D-alanyl-D-alanine carboxypeptidase